MAVAAWLVWQRRNRRWARTGLRLFLVQLALNALWPAAFFALRNPEIAVFEIVVLWLVLVATSACFAVVSRLAALLMTFYLGWVTFAAVLTYSIWKNNPIG
jgi:benzodiazapine receptor